MRLVETRLHACFFVSEFQLSFLGIVYIVEG